MNGLESFAVQVRAAGLQTRLSSGKLPPLNLSRIVSIAAAALVLGLPFPAFATPATATRTSAFDYDPNSGLLTKEIIEPGDPDRCLVTEYTHDANGNKVSATTRNCDGRAGTAGTLNTEAAAPSPLPTSYARFESRTATSFYALPGSASLGRLPVKTINALGHYETKEWDYRFGTIQKLTGPNNLTAEWMYDGFGRKILEKRADGNKTQWDYLYCVGVNGGNAPCPTIGGAAGAYVVVITPLASSDVPNGPISKTYYDALDRPIRSETQGFDGRAIYQDTQYDSLGRPYKRSRPYYADQTAYWTTTTYDSLGRVHIVTEADGNVTTTDYNGLTVIVTDPNEQTHITTKNSEGQVARVTDARNSTLRYQYDPFGNLTQTTDSLGNVTALEYDNRGRKKTMHDPDMGTWSYDYDALGQLVRQRDSRLNTVTMSYDKLGRMTRRAETDLISNWYYDTGKSGAGCPRGIGKLCEVETDHGYYRSHSYDLLGRHIVTVTAFENTMFYSGVSYDGNGRLATQTDPGGFAVRNVYTDKGYLKEVRDNTSNALYWRANSMDAEGRLLQETVGDAYVAVEVGQYWDDDIEDYLPVWAASTGVTTQRNYSPMNGRLSTVVAGPANSVQNLGYTYDRVGNIKSRQDLTQGLIETFDYDALNRLRVATVNASGAGIVTQNFEYDDLGNITSRSNQGSYTYPVSGAGSVRPHAVSRIDLPAGGHRKYDWDGNGNFKSSTQYDASNQAVPGGGRVAIFNSFDMPSVIHDDGTSDVKLELSLYGPEHQRLVRSLTTSAGTSRTVYLNPDNVGGLSYEKETTFDNSIEQRSFITAYGQVVAVAKKITTAAGATTNQVLYFHRDNLGSTSAVTDGTGAVVERMAYEPFGKRRAPNGTTLSDTPTAPLTTVRGFTNHEHIDPLGLIHMNGRIYNPAIGRFMSADPTIQSPGNLQSYNRYSYTWNNPLRYTDPSGYCLTPGDLGIAGFPTQPVGCSSNQVEVFVRTIAVVAVTVVTGAWAANSYLAANMVATAEGVMGYTGGIAGMSTATTAGALGAAAGGFAGGFVASNGDFQAGMEGAVSALLFNAVGTATNGHNVSSDYFGTADHFANVAGHAAVGCAMAAAQGGNCNSGALSAGFGATFTPLLPKGIPGLMITSTVGGTASLLGGGRFANGAVTAAYGYLFNQASQRFLVPTTEEPRIRWSGDVDWKIDIALDKLLKGVTTGFFPKLTVKYGEEVGINEYEYRVYSQPVDENSRPTGPARATASYVWKVDPSDRSKPTRRHFRVCTYRDLCFGE